MRGHSLAPQVGVHTAPHRTCRSGRARGLSSSTIRKMVTGVMLPEFSSGMLAVGSPDGQPCPPFIPGRPYCRRSRPRRPNRRFSVRCRPFLQLRLAPRQCKSYQVFISCPVLHGVGVSYRTR
jgi:hypothetical protein